MITFFIDKIEPGYYIKGKEQQSATCFMEHGNDYLMANILKVFPDQYSTFLKELGGHGPWNLKTYFKTEAEANTVLPIIQQLYDMKAKINILSNQNTVSSENANNVRGNVILAYKNMQSYQGISEDENTSTDDSKDTNMNVEENVYTQVDNEHYTIL
jgi:hypothetical protein